MVQYKIWYADADEPTEWFEAVIIIDGEEGVTCDCCGKLDRRSYIDVGEGYARLCMSDITAMLDSKEIRVLDREFNRQMPDDLPFRGKVVDLARELGGDVGKSMASWVFDGNTTKERYAEVLKGHEDGDPAILDSYRSPLSGEYADDITPNGVLDRLDVTMSDDQSIEDYDDLIDAFEEGCSAGFWDEVVRVAKLQLEEVTA